jgi:long-chain acyl-CoA synthetase
VNLGLARYETLKKILLVPDEFTTSDGSLTPTLKLRRKAVEARYREQIDELYREADTSVVA